MYRLLRAINRFVNIAGTIFFIALIGGLEVVFIGAIGSGIVCAPLLGLNLVAGSGIVMCDPQRTFITLALVIGCLTAIFLTWSFRDMWKDLIVEEYPQTQA